MHFNEVKFDIWIWVTDKYQLKFAPKLTFSMSLITQKLSPSNSHIHAHNCFLLINFLHYQKPHLENFLKTNAHFAINNHGIFLCLLIIPGAYVISQLGNHLCEYAFETQTIVQKDNIYECESVCEMVNQSFDFSYLYINTESRGMHAL